MQTLDMIQMYIDGCWTSGEGSDVLKAESPVTGEVIGKVVAGTRGDAQAAVKAAQAAAGEWAGQSPFARADVLERVAALVQERAEALAESVTLDQGKPLSEARDEVHEVVEMFRWYAAEARRFGGGFEPSADPEKRVLVYRVPVGVVGVIAPWNWPLSMAAELVAPALAAGNTVVWAASPTTSVCSTGLAQCIADAGFPGGVFNYVTGEGPVVGDEVAGNSGVHAVGFIGSIATGAHVASRAAGKPALLELGGNGPMVILDDADMDRAVEASLTAVFMGAGQSCTAGENFLVHEAVHDEFVEKITAAVKERVKLGDPRESGTTMGPVHNEDTAAKVESQIEEAKRMGAVVLTGGRRSPDYPTRLYFEPTVLRDVNQSMRVAYEESFGPVLPITKIKSDEEALEIAKAAGYGLLTAVWTRDLTRALRYAEATPHGLVNINESTNYWEAHLPFGGKSGTNSGQGRVGGRYPLDTFSETKTVVIHLGQS